VPALFVGIDHDDATALGLQSRTYAGEMNLANVYERYQAASLALLQRFGELAHGSRARRCITASSDAFSWQRQQSLRRQL
jgi:hypothetical protein